MMPNSDMQQVELYLSCRQLRDLDYFGKSDPRVKVFMKNHGNWSLIGETEKIMDNLNPDFQRTIVTEYVFETQQPMKFEVWDVDDTTADDIIGVAETTLGDIMGARKQTLVLELHSKGKKSTGKLIIKGDKTGNTRNQIFMQWSGAKLMNTDGMFNKSDPFLRFFKSKAGGDWLQVHQTEVIKNNLNPVWTMCKVSDDKLCGSDHSKPIRIECWDDEKSGKHQFIGAIETTIDQLKSGQNQFALLNPKKNNVGTLKVLSFSIQEKPTFLDYIRGGEQLNVIAAIDFTGSNGNPKSPGSLHAQLGGGQLNEYQQAIYSVCRILLSYDYDQMIPVFGFGGKPHYPTLNSVVVSHCFPCSGNIQQAQVAGLPGVMEVYSYALQNVELSGPTYFAPIITEAMKVCQINKQNEADIYTVLLILTDGEIHDMDETIDAIVEGAYLPFSIVIIGVGNADFTKMEILDGDKGLVNTKGKKSSRDYVQFVSFRNFKDDVSMLARHVLAEIPEQLVEYKALIGQKPKVPHPR